MAKIHRQELVAVRRYGEMTDEIVAARNCKENESENDERRAPAGEAHDLRYGRDQHDSVMGRSPTGAGALDCVLLRRAGIPVNGRPSSLERRLPINGWSLCASCELRAAQTQTWPVEAPSP